MAATHPLVNPAILAHNSVSLPMGAIEKEARKRNKLCISNNAAAAIVDMRGHGSRDIHFGRLR
jgi:hypothetical protein